MKMLALEKTLPNGQMNTPEVCLMAMKLELTPGGFEVPGIVGVCVSILNRAIVVAGAIGHRAESLNV